VKMILALYLGSYVTHLSWIRLLVTFGPPILTTFIQAEFKVFLFRCIQGGVVYVHFQQNGTYT
jgi:hypothetical protein